jgi:hypothetical protein
MRVHSAPTLTRYAQGGWCLLSDAGLVPVNLGSSVTREVLVLLGFLLVLRVGVYAALRRATATTTA